MNRSKIPCGCFLVSVVQIVAAVAVAVNKAVYATVAVYAVSLLSVLCVVSHQFWGKVSCGICFGWDFYFFLVCVVVV